MDLEAAFTRNAGEDGSPIDRTNGGQRQQGEGRPQDGGGLDSWTHHSSTPSSACRITARSLTTVIVTSSNTGDCKSGEGIGLPAPREAP